MFNRKKKTEEFKQEPDIKVDDVEVAEDTGGDMLIDLPDEVKKPKKKLPGWVIIPVLAVLGLGVFGASKLAGGSDKPQSLQVVEVEKGDVSQVYNTSGTVESERTKVFYSAVNAPISSCKAKVGEAVKSGDVLITYDITTLDRDNQQSQLNLQSAYNTSESTKAQNAKSINAANAANASAAASANALADEVNSLAGQVDSAYGQYQANIKEAEKKAPEIKKQQDILTAQTKREKDNQKIIDETNDGYQGRRADYDAACEKKKAGNADANDEAVIAALKPVFEKYDQAILDLEDAKNQIKAADEVLSKLQVDIDDAGYAELQAQYEAKYAEWKASYAAANSGGTPETGMSGAELDNLSVSNNLAELAALSPQEMLAKGKEGVKAEFDGIISDVKAIEGSSSVQGGELFTLVSNRDVSVKLEVSANDFDNLVIGNKATIKVGKKTYKGTLKSIDKIAIPNEKGTSVIGARVHIDNPDQDIYIGVGAKVSMTVAEGKGVLCLPNEVVNTSADGDFVYVIKEGAVAKKPVELGVASNSMVEIVSGLKEGDQVVKDTTGSITEGMKATAVVAAADTESETSGEE